MEGHMTGKRVQLHRALSKLGWGSRGLAWQWIRAGQVRVDGRIVTDPLTWVDLDRQRITRQGAEAGVRERLVLALHKPAGVVTTRSDERGRRTVYDLLPSELPWLFPAGRLDADSEGLLVLTNDSALAVRLTAPEHGVAKTYRVSLDRRPTEETLAAWRRGVELADGTTRPAEVRTVTAKVVEVVLREGRNRQIRRTAQALGHRVRRLVRTAIGGLLLGDLPSGGHRLLTEADVRLLTADAEQRTDQP
jgi:23S rRNA pseudouridine2605 synthase